MATVADESTLSQLGTVGSVPRPAAGGARRRLVLLCLPLAPFFLYVIIFLLLPTVWLVVGAFQDSAGTFTTDNMRSLTSGDNLDAYKTSIELSVTTALTGAIFGFFVAYAMVQEGAPGWIRALLSTFAGVATNFAGIPLAFAFVATLGTTGVVTVFLNGHGVHIYQSGFTVYSFGGLVMVYTYFQMPLMLLVISPALDGLRREWREAATSLGASKSQFWRWVGLPILWPSLLGAFVLLFGSAFSAYATTVALVGSQINLVPIRIGSILSGDFAADPNQANALAVGMIIIIAAVMVVYAVLQRRTSRWLR